MIEAQELLERALRCSTADETIVLVTDTGEASLRWAGNSMTTNGISRSRSWTVIAVQRGDTPRVGVVTSSSVDPADIAPTVRAAGAAAAAASPAEDAMPL
ncbi:PmbA/TldA family metallopeptidase, partial [Rhodococcus sp. ENV425]